MVWVRARIGKDFIMNFKKILVLVMAMVMAVSAFAPTAAAFDAHTAHDHYENAVEGVQDAIDEIVTFVSENYDEAYEYGFTYVLENGYFDNAINSLEAAIAVMSALEVEVPAEFSAHINAELDACVDSLADMKAIVENLSVENGEGALVSLLALVADFNAHVENLNNLYGECEELGYVAGAKALVKEYADKVNAALEEIVDIVYDQVSEYIVEAAQTYYPVIEELYGEISNEVYNRVVEMLVKVRATAIRVHAVLMDVNETIMDVLDTVDVVVANVIDTCIRTAEFLVELYESVEDSLDLVADIFNDVFDYVVAHKSYIKSVALGTAKDLYNRIVEKVLATYGRTQSVLATAKAIYNYVVKAVVYIAEELYSTVYHSVNGNYVLDSDSYYVAIGNGVYAEELAGMVHLADKFNRFELGADYSDALAGADLITIDFTQNGLFEYATAQAMGIVAETLRNNQTLMSWYNHSNPAVSAAIQEQFVIYGVDIDAEVEELDWSKYISASKQAVLDSYLAKVKAEAIESGVPEVYTIHLGDVIVGVLEENVGKFPGLTVVCDVEIPVADILTFAVENALYKYVEFTYTVAETLEEINVVAPEATVVVTGLDNPLAHSFDGMEIMGIKLDTVGIACEALVHALNFELYTFALADKDVAFVPTQNAGDIYDAINFTCAHVYDNCDDVVCNLCDAEREAVAHVFENYTFNNNATCTKNGTETAKCENCDITNTREKANSMLPHSWKNATCTEPKTCKDCGAKEGSVIDHKYGDWKVVKEPTDVEEGLREKVCSACGHKIQETLPMVDSKMSPLAIAGIVILVVAVLCGASYGVYWYTKKRNNA